MTLLPTTALSLLIPRGISAEASDLAIAASVLVGWTVCYWWGLAPILRDP